jgi:hypothetical protein
LGQPGASDGLRREHDDDDVYAAYIRRRKAPERAQSDAPHVGGEGEQTTA